MKEIKLMADYHCHPLWGGEPDHFGDISPEGLPISSDLQNSLADWAKRYDAILNIDDPALSDFSSLEAKKLFIEDGYKLAERLQKELGSTYKIIYYSNY